jgi:hypothetical protein
MGEETGGEAATEISIETGKLALGEYLGFKGLKDFVGGLWTDLGVDAASWLLKPMKSQPRDPKETAVDNPLRCGGRLGF